MTTRRWIISHRCSWITVYVYCRNAQLNTIVIIMPCICIVMRSLFVNCPAVICSPSMLVIFYWRDTTNELSTPVHSFTLIKPQTANCSFFILCILILIFHTRRLILCFQQAGDIDNLTVMLGQSIVIVLCAGPRWRSCCAVRAANNLLKSCYSYWFDKPWFLSEGKLAAELHNTFLLGSHNEHVIHAIKLFF